MQLICILLAFADPAGLGRIEGRVVDRSGAPVSSAVVSAPGVAKVSTSPDGTFRLSGVAAGEHEISASAAGFDTARRKASAGAIDVELVLVPATVVQEVLVSAGLIAGVPEHIAQLPGAAHVLDAATLRESRLFTFEEALRKAPGVFARPEEGFGLRPNIGIRGMNPTRSSRVLLLEDGVPLAYAPYGDNASYYHPPVDRFDSIEIVKGAGQIAYGPMTVGGVVNYITPSVPERTSGSIALTGGNRDYVNAHVQFGGAYRGTGLLFDGIRKQGEGSRDNTRSGLDDYTFKAIRTISSSHALSFKTNLYREDSRVTYSGLRVDEWNANPRQNPFRNDTFTGYRWGASATHTWVFSPSSMLTTTGYGSIFSRDWWRQSSNSSQRPNTNCGGMAFLHISCGNEGRLRDYSTWGVEPRFRIRQFEGGLRIHSETQERLQVNGASPLARTGLTVENNQRRNLAYSGYAQNRFQFGKFAITPGLRLEHIRLDRTNRLFSNGLGVFGKAAITQWIPGIGVTYNPSSRLTVFAGAHRGFAPPRTEDVITNSGGFVELDPELSWNYEIGFRARPSRSLQFDATAFRLDYQNQIVAASLAGGVGSLLTSAGRTLHQGAEFSGRWDHSRGLFLRASYTWLPIAKYTSYRLSGSTLITGNRLPYAAASLLNGQAGYRHRTGWNAFVEGVQTGRMFGDDLNTINPTADGQRGALPGNVIWNATLNVPIESKRTVLFITAKNLTDRVVLVDRARGMLPGSPRLIQVGVRFGF